MSERDTAVSPHDSLPPRQQGLRRRSSGGISSNMALVLVALCLVVGFVAGTRSRELYAAIAPVFGVKASADTLDLQLVQQAYQELKANYDGKLDKKTLVDGAARGMTEAAGDQYTVFMDKQEAEAFAQQLSGEVSGIGCEIGIRSKQPTILRVLNDSPAEQAGVKAGDVVTSVNDTSVVGSDSGSVAEKIRGQAGTSVKVVVLRGQSSKEFTITRAKINDSSVRWSVEGGIGRMIISRFDSDTGDLAAKAAGEFKRAGVRGVIVDMRDNGGGYLDAARDVASLWLHNKAIVTEKTSDVVTERVMSRGDTLLAGMKTVVLINGGSASASEIVAGALQDYKVATVIGEKSFGKGSVQKLISLPDGRQLKVTIARWYTPNGKNITKEGISPDKTVVLTSDDTNAGKDPQLEAAQATL